MSSPTPAAAAPAGPSTLQIVLALIGDAGEIGDLIGAVEAAVAAEKAATTFRQRVDIAVPVAQKAADLADKIKGQV